MDTPFQQKSTAATPFQRSVGLILANNKTGFALGQYSVTSHATAWTTLEPPPPFNGPRRNNNEVTSID